MADRASGQCFIDTESAVAVGSNAGLEREIGDGRNGKLLIVWRTETDPPSTNLYCRDSGNVRQQRKGKVAFLVNVL